MTIRSLRYGNCANCRPIREATREELALVHSAKIIDEVLVKVGEILKYYWTVLSSVITDCVRIYVCMYAFPGGSVDQSW